MERAQFYERLFFEVIILMVKDKKYGIKDTMSIKNSFIHYMKWTRVMLPEVFDKFELVCIFVAIFFTITASK